MQATKSEQVDHRKQSPPGSIRVSAIVSRFQHGSIRKIGCGQARAMLVEGAVSGSEGAEAIARKLRQEPGKERP